MPVKLFTFLLKRQRIRFGKRKTAGFTLLELLVSIVISTVIIIALLDMVVDLLQTDRREYARAETQREMQMSLDYMVNDLREAAYVYDNNQLNGNRGSNNNVPALKTYLPPFPAGMEPILVFWKPEEVPYRRGQPALNCGGSPSDDCKQLQVRRRTFTLVAYLQAVNQPADRPQWKGISRIMRYQLRMYPETAFNASPPTLTTINTGYVEPLVNNVSFETWPVALDANGNPLGAPARLANDPLSRPVLVDFVDYPTTARGDNLATPADTRLQCTSPNQPPIPPSTSAFTNPSFVACVSSATATGAAGGTSSPTNQNVILFLRGNPTGKAGVKIAPLIAVKTQAVARGVIDKKPN
ncbi:prepilin-type N-terminal cleavage/methylation domain-containing protein [Argonema galeatum]|uniref:prepilin-type N-terminal cleavage/methylation domain-containing protein n=1 Tax=Argonema galeatum TaxID=2942762 RepID=UPI002013B596|nr:prepilin-type N-terminal cleavage/methylation domain-containing protein [Argonema galeatum]MCL1464469.1 prepilin-type N-terminal cleavage/methylation domain-containing protein [Argonema galeatum A003/A1]